MTLRSRSTSLGISGAVVLSMGLSSVALQAHAAAPSHTTQHPAKHQAKAKAKAKAGNACTGKKKVAGKGLVTFSDWQFPDTMNVPQSNIAVTQNVAIPTQDSLFQYNAKAQLVPQMVTQMPTAKNGGIKNNGKTWTLHIKPGLKWSNGATLTSQDIKFSWQAAMDKASGPYCSGSCDVISRIDTPNNTTLVMHLTHTYAPFLAYGTSWPLEPRVWPGAWSNDPHAAATKVWQDTAFNYESTNFPTNGPYQVSQFVNNDRIVLTPMKYYNDETCGAQLKQLIFSFYSSKPGLIAAAASKQTDITGFGGGYTAADLPDLQKSKSYRILSGAGFNIEHMEFNLDPTYNGQTNPLHNTNVRLALALALDKIGVIRSALGLTPKQAKNIVAWTPWVNTPTLVQPFADKSITGQWDPIAKKYVQPGTAQALKDAKTLLSKTPFASGFTLDADTTTGNPVRVAQFAVAQSNWARIGVKLNLNYIPASKFFTDWDHGGTLQHGQFQVGMWGYTGQPDPDQWHYNVQSQYCDRSATVHVQTNENEACINDKLIDKQMKIGAQSLNSKTRAAAYKAVQVEMNKMAYWEPLYFRLQIVTTDGKAQNVQNNPTQFGVTSNAYAWKIKGAA